MTAERRYRAFISYSHSDRKWAMWLLRSLETWRVPSRLVGQTTARGEIPARLSPLFADREELSATDNLRASLVSALAHSDALIVICSPAAAQSLWVEQEILRYRELHPDGLILALIVAGDPAAASADQQCFPRALLCQQHPDGSWTAPVYEPVAADARPQADGRYRAKLKLIAGLLAVDLDNLVAREQQRQQRKWIAMAAASLVGMAVMTTLTVFAYRARNEAEHRHAQAEGLIEFMLTDLRQKLEPVGRLDALQVVGEKAMTYYSDEAPDNMQADALGRRQRVMHLLGEIQELRGNLDDAFTLFEQAAKVTDELLQRAPTDPQRIFDHAQSEFWVGYLAWRQQNLPDAEQRFQSYLSLAKNLVAIDPKNPAWQTELASAHGNVGIVQLSKQQYSEAIESFSTLKALNQTALAAQPSSETRLMLAQSLAWLADAQEANWQFLAAKASRQEELGLYQEGLKTDPENALLLRSQHVCLRKLAALAVAQGELSAADTLLKESIEIIEKLVQLEAGNTLWQELKARAFIERGSTLALTSQPSQNPAPLLQTAIAILGALQTTNSSVAAWKESQLRAEYWLTRAQGVGRESAALRILKSKIDGIADATSSEEMTEIKLSIYNQLARSSTVAEEPSALWQHVLSTLPKNKKLSPTLQLQACLALLGLNDNALFTTCSELDRAGYQHPDFVPVSKHLRAQKV